MSAQNGGVGPCPTCHYGIGSGFHEIPLRTHVWAGCFDDRDVVEILGLLAVVAS